MNNYTKVGEYIILLDNGALELMAEVTAKNWLDPTEGITDAKEKWAVILFGGMARNDEEEGRPVQKSLDEVRKMMRKLTPAHLMQINKAWAKLMDVGESAGEQSEEEKKS